MAALVVVLGAAAAATDVLMIAVDDLRPQLACTDVPGTVRPTMHTPHICGFANDSLVLLRSQVAMATCSPSRTALLTGRHATTTHVWDLFTYFRNATGNFTTLPQFFKERGYSTHGMGKIYHPGGASGGGSCEMCTGPDDGTWSWSEPYFHGVDEYDKSPHNSWMAVPANESRKTPLQDTQIADHAVATLKNISARRAAGATQPFFVAVGFHKPHLPFVFPESFLAQYPASSISLPANAYAPDGMPAIAWQTYGETRNYDDIAKLHATGQPNTTLPDAVVKALRRAYYSAVSYTDHNIGTVLSTLDAEGMRESTIVAFWGDHGWQLGEHGLWDKHTNFDLATHAPVMFRVPGLTDGGVRTYEFTETVDIFPTLVDFALGETMERCPLDSQAVALCTEGTSLRPLIGAPTTAVKAAAFSVYSRPIPSGIVEDDEELEDTSGGPSASACLDWRGTGKGCAMGYTMLTHADGATVRYTEWVHYPGPTNGWAPKWETSYGTELYNHTFDPSENRNLFASVRGTALAKTLAARLHGGWEGSGRSALTHRK